MRAECLELMLVLLLLLVDLGLEELAGSDRRFEAYRKTLFNPDTLKLDRELQSRELNEKLDGSIRTFLRILSNYILLKPAHQILEYLIRRYKFVSFTSFWIDQMCCARGHKHEIEN